MALILKMAEGVVELKDGKPVYIDDADNNRELVFDAEQMRTKISELNGESAKHRHTAKELGEKLAAFNNADPQTVTQLLKAVEDIGGIDGLAELKKKGNIDVEGIKKSISESFQKRIDELETNNTVLTARERQLLIGNGFASSKFLAEKTILPPDVAEAYFGKHFRVEDGKVVAYIGENKVFSKERPGEPATIEEALQEIVAQYPMKDRILRAPGGGGGAGGSGGGAFGLIRSRSDLKTDAAKAAFISENGLEAYKKLPAS